MTSLAPPDPYGGGRMTDRLEAIAAFRAQVGGEVPILGWVEGALAQAIERLKREIVLCEQCPCCRGTEGC